MLPSVSLLWCHLAFEFLASDATASNDSSQGWEERERNPIHGMWEKGFTWSYEQSEKVSTVPTTKDERKPPP